MSYQSRSIRIQAKKSKRKLLTTIIVIILLLYGTLNWILPSFIGGVGYVKGVFTPDKLVEKPISETEILAPPVIFIPYEATNTAKINIKGYANGSKIKLYLNDELKEIVDVQLDGNFTAENVSLKLGENNIYGKSADDKDQESLSSKTITISYDNQEPSLIVSEPDGDKEASEDKITVSGQTDPEGQIFINSTRLIVGSDGKFSTSFPLTEGENNLVIKAVDKASNSTEITRKITFKKPEESPSPTPTQ